MENAKRGWIKIMEQRYGNDNQYVKNFSRMIRWCNTPEQIINMVNETECNINIQKEFIEKIKNKYKYN